MKTINANDQVISIFGHNIERSSINYIEMSKGKDKTKFQFHNLNGKAMTIKLGKEEGDALESKIKNAHFVTIADDFIVNMQNVISADMVYGSQSKINVTFRNDSLVIAGAGQEDYNFIASRIDIESVL